jgi:hypothetical protein
METIKIYKRGTKVKINLNKKEGYIHSVTIFGTEIIYTIYYSDNDTWMTLDTIESQFKILNNHEVETQTIGFK